MDPLSRFEGATTRRSFVAAVVGSAASGCLGSPGDGDERTPANGDDAGPAHQRDDRPTATEAWQPPAEPPTDARVTETTAVAGLDVPWDLAIAGTETYLSEREVGVRRFETEDLLGERTLDADDAELVVSPDDVPDFANPQFGGFLGVAAHPDYPDPAAIYLYHTAGEDDPQNRVIRYDLDRASATTLVDGIGGPDNHLGGRLEFGPTRNLWITTGDNNDPSTARDPSSLAGAILRITPTGDVPASNPAIDGADPRIVTYGHRNPQGLAFTPDGRGFLTEHGPSGRDEVAAIDPGADYGWPRARGGPDDPEYAAYDEGDRFAPPIVNTGPETTWAPSGATFYTSEAIAAWTNRLFVAGLASETLYAVTLVRDGPIADSLAGETGVRYDDPWLDERYDAVVHARYAGEYGRLRLAAQGPDGALFLLTSNRDGWATDPFPTDRDDRVVRIDPA